MGTTRASSIKRKEPEPDVVAKGKPTANGTHTANGSPTEAGTPVANGKTTGTARATRSSTASKASPRGDAKEEVKPVPFQVAGAGSAKRKAPEPDVVANGKPSANGTHVPNGKPAANGSPLANGTPVANGNTPGSARVTRSSTGCKVPVKGDAKDEGAAVKPVPFALENGVSKVNGVSNRETPAKKSPAVAMVSPKLKRGESTPQVVANGAATSNGTASKSGTKGRKVADTPQSKKARQTEQNGTPASVRRATPDHSGSSDSYHEDEQDEENEVEVEVVEKKPASRKNLLTKKKNKDGELVCQFLGDPIPDAEAKKRWPERYKKKSSKSNVVKSADEDEDIFARQHYTKADVEGVVYNLGDDVYVKAEDGSPNFIGRIVEFFVSIDMKLFFTAQWFFRAEDTIELKRQQSIPPCDLYYDMSYSLSYTSFAKLHSDKRKSKSESSDATASLLDLYSGCGAMSTGLCLGAHLNKLKLVTRWAVDLSPYACASLKYNHSETHVRNENAENFLELLKEWEKLSLKSHPCFNNTIDDDSGEVNEDDPTSEGDSGDCEEIFEVEKLVDIRYGDPDDSDIKELMFKVRWKGYGPEEDKWEPLKNLNCPERIELFVEEGLKAKILPLPGDVDVICGGPPCQGISGFNRFRNRESPLDDTKNQQIVVYMDIVQHLKPKFVLMENVVDLLKFAEGFLGRYAISRLVKLNYQTRLGIMAAGCYGLPQFRLRAFLWGALPSENLPKFPLPTHNVVLRGGIPNAFERNLVAFDEDQPRNLKKELFLKDAISDLPPVENDESRDEISYRRAPKTDFQYYIRAKPDEMHKFPFNAKELELVDTLYDHRPLRLNTDDFQRVQYIPKKKGANFRDMPGLRVRPDNVIELDSNVERRLLPSGKPLVPDYAISFMKGRSLKPFGRLWWDGTVPTVVTRAEPHNQIILHPEQDRVLTIRENARLQGLPDYYKLTGPVKERYIQVGNAVAVPVARALGYALAQAFRGLGDPNDPLLVLPENFP